MSEVKSFSAARRSTRRRSRATFPLILACPPNPPYTNYMDSQPEVKFVKKKAKLPNSEKYDYSGIIKSAHLKCLPNLRYKTMEEIEQAPQWPGRPGGKKEEGECIIQEFITVPTRYSKASFAVVESQLDETSTDGEADENGATLGEEQQFGEENQEGTDNRSSHDDNQEENGGDDASSDGTTQTGKSERNSKTADDDVSSVGTTQTGKSERNSKTADTKSSKRSSSKRCSRTSKQSGCQSAETENCAEENDESANCSNGSASAQKSSANNGTEFVCCICQERFLCSKMNSDNVDTASATC